MRRLHFALLSLVLVLVAQPLFATTYYVTPPLANPCTSAKGGFEVFPSIQYAVTHVPEGSTINICPGTYYEQVTISQPLTLRGVSYGNSSKAVIVVPPGGLTTTPSLFAGTVAAQVEVTAEDVNITDITVDGTASSSNCPSDIIYVGIFYSSGSSGTVNEVETRYQNCFFVPTGIGILAENGELGRSVTIENSNIHDYSADGIFAYGADGADYTVSIKNNYVYGSEGNVSIGQLASAGDVSDNTVTGAETGIYVDADVVVSDNTVTNSTSVGIDVEAKATVTSNRISNSEGGIGLSTGGATIKDNTIQSSTGVGIEFGCYTNTVSGNTINGAATGINDVPTAFNGVNTFHNVSTVRTSGC
jgi:parallel beta-helix repeat protein/putative cofactor-binding repeat protein